MPHSIHLIAHDIRSRENVGALFRMADALGVTKIWLSGYTPAPPDEKISKTALGAETWISFEHHVSIDQVFARLSEENIPCYALERVSGAMMLPMQKPSESTIALLLGTETTGIPQSLLERCAGVIQIPQVGKKESLNVSMAAAIAVWEWRREDFSV
ncbi:TrmH family RNA methyltransferase [Patescibacteria group bacterium]|nr:TrmH family RNA methyltransferase [Patescibacteria group bacterium]